MTLKQIETLENFIKDIDRLLIENYVENNSISNIEYYTNAKTLCNKIQSYCSEFKPVVSWCSAAYQATRDNLEVMKAGVEGVLQKIPNYNEICIVREDIGKGESLSDDNDKADFIVQIRSKYDGKIKFSKQEDNFCNEWCFDTFTLINHSDLFFMPLIDKLKMYLSQLTSNKKQHNTQKSVDKMNVTIQNNNSPTLINNNHIDFRSEVNNIVELVKTADIEDSKQEEILQKITELQEINNETNKNKKGKKVREVFKWLAEQTLQVASWIVPLIIPLLPK